MRKRQESAPGVAPADLIREDSRALEQRDTLRTTRDIEQMILMQTIEGHAHTGHGTFYGKRFPNTTLDDISRALRQSPQAVKEERQALIDDIRIYAERAARGEDVTMLLNEDDEPLMGIGTFRELQVDPQGVLQGLYLGGLRDQFDIRAEAQEKFGVTIGFGKSYWIDRRVMHEMGLSGDVLSQQGHADDIGEFKRRGLIVDGPDGEDISYMYIRHQAGPGASDDAAVVMAGKLYGFSAAVGCFLADAIDTLEKYAARNEDQDAFIGRIVEKSDRGLGLTRDDVIDLTYLAAVPEGRPDVPDSSLRHLLLLDRRSDQCALESHLLYVEGKPQACQELDHGQVTNVEFYRYIEEHLAEYRKRG